MMEKSAGCVVCGRQGSEQGRAPACRGRGYSASGTVFQLPTSLLSSIPGFIIWLISPDSKHLLVSWTNSCTFCENNKTRLNDVNSGKRILDTLYWQPDYAITLKVCLESSPWPQNSPKWPAINSSAGGCFHLNTLSPDCVSPAGCHLHLKFTFLPFLESRPASLQGLSC